MKLSGQIIAELRLVISKRMRESGMTMDSAEMTAMRVIDAIETHPTLKVARVGVRVPTIPTPKPDGAL